MTGLAERALAKYRPPSRKDERFRYVQLRGLDEKPGSGVFEVEGDVLAYSLEDALMTFGAQLQVKQEKLVAAEEDPFALLNAAHSKEGLFVYVSPDQKKRAVLSHRGEAGMLYPRFFVHVGRNSELHLTFNQFGEMANRFFDFTLEENAKLFVHFSSFANAQLDTIRGSCKRDSFFKSVSVQQASAFLRQDYHFSLDGVNACCELYGVSKAEQAHTYVLMKHCAENTRSSQKFKAVVDEKQRASFEGKIFVEKQAQKTDAYQMNQVLLLSPHAKAYSKPNLEIFADDVKASHGATVGQIDPEEIFYLQSRGISKKDAKKLLIEGFIQEIINEIS